MNFAPLENANANLTRSAERYSKAAASFRESKKISPAGLNKKLLQAEQLLLAGEGLPKRPWFKHQIYAPGFYTGYGVKTIPGVREAIEQKQWQEFDTQVARVAQALLALAAHVDAASAELEKTR